jgi:hypothetical protein
MQLRLLVPVFLQQLLLPVFCIALTSCQSHKANAGPSIEFTHIPLAAQGRREKVDTISGRVRNARPKQQIVIYAHSGQWWVQPRPAPPFIPIKADSTWSTETHLGFEYAALLVEPDYHPQPKRDVEVGRWGDAANKNNAQYVIRPFYNRSEVTKRGRARRVFVLVSLLLVAPLTSDRDGDR